METETNFESESDYTYNFKKLNRKSERPLKYNRIVYV